MDLVALEIAEVDLHVGRDWELLVLCEFHASVPRPLIELDANICIFPNAIYPVHIAACRLPGNCRHRVGRSYHPQHDGAPAGRRYNGNELARSISIKT